MERASEGSRFNQTGCGHSTASATAFVPNAESRQRPAIEQRCSRTKEPNEAIGFFLFFLISLFKTHRHNFLSRETVFYFPLVQSSGFTGSMFLDLFNTFKALSDLAFSYFSDLHPYAPSQFQLLFWLLLTSNLTPRVPELSAVLQLITSTPSPARLFVTVQISAQNLPVFICISAVIILLCFTFSVIFIF